MEQMKIYRVAGVALSRVPGDEPAVLVETLGYPASKGWSDVKLIVVDDNLADDGILDLELVGMPPTRPVRSARVYPVSANFMIDHDLDRLVGVRVAGRSNAVSRLMVEPPKGTARHQRNMGFDQPGDVTFEEGEDPPEDPTHVSGEDITFLEEGEEAPTLAEEPSDIMAENPTFFEAGEEAPTLAEDIPSDASAEEPPPTGDENTPTVGEEVPTFSETETNPWVEALPTWAEDPSNPNLEGPTVVRVENPKNPWENDPGSWPGPFEDPSLPQRTTDPRQYVWVYRNGRYFPVPWNQVRRQGQVTPFGRW